MFVVLADDHALVRDAIAALLHHHFKFDVIQASDAGDAVKFTRQYNPMLVIMDLMMKGMDTFEAATQIRQISPHTKTMIISGRDSVDLVLRARKHKIHGYILKGDSPGETQYAIKTVLGGGCYVPPSLSPFLLDPERTCRTSMEVLTPKERSTLSLIAQGMTMREIGKCMGITAKTAETHRNNIGRKLGHPNRAQLVAYAMQHNLVDSSSLQISA